MNEDQVSHLQRSFRAVLPIKEQAAAAFYSRLFAIDPGLRPMFAHTDMAAQGAKLMAAIGFVVGSLRQPIPMLAAVRALAVRHVGYGVQERHYPTVGAALLWTLEAGLGEAWTPPLAAAWAEAFAVVSGTMIEAAAEARRASNLAAA